MFLSCFVEEINQATVGILISFPNKMNEIILPVIFWSKNIKDSVYLGKVLQSKKKFFNLEKPLLWK